MNKGLQNYLRRAARNSTFKDLLFHFSLCQLYSISCHFIFIILDHTFHFEKNLRSIGLAITLLIPSSYIIYYLIKRSNQRLNLIYVATEIEQRHPSLKNRLVSQLMSKQHSEEAEEKLTEDLSKLPQLNSDKRLQKTLLGIVTLIFLFSIYSFTSFKSSKLSLARLYYPLGNIPYPTKTMVVNTSPQDGASIFVDRNWKLILKSSGLSPENGLIRIHSSKDNFEEFNLIKSNRGEFYCDLPAIGNKLEYDIFLGDAKLTGRKVSFERKPKIKKFTVSIKTADYLGAVEKSQTQKSIQTYTGSKIKFNLTYDQKIDKAEILWEDKVQELQTNFQGVYNRIPLVVNKPGTYSFRVKSSSRDEFYESPKYYISVIEDKPPIIKFTDPKIDQTFNANSLIDIGYSATDDISLKDIFLKCQFKFSGQKKIIPIQKGIHSSAISGKFKLELSNFKIKHDDSLILNLLVSDFNDSDKHQIISEPIAVKIQSLKKVPVKDTVFTAIDKKYGEKSTLEEVGNNELSEINKPDDKSNLEEKSESHSSKQDQLEPITPEEVKIENDEFSNDESVKDRKAAKSEDQNSTSKQYKTSQQNSSNNTQQVTDKTKTNEQVQSDQQTNADNQNANGTQSGMGKQGGTGEQTASGKSGSGKQADSEKEGGFNSQKSKNQSPLTTKKKPINESVEDKSSDSELAQRDIKKKDLKKLEVSEKQKKTQQLSKKEDIKTIKKSPAKLNKNPGEIDGNLTAEEEEIEKGKSKITESKIQKFSEEEQELNDLFNKELKRINSQQKSKN